VIKDKDVVLSLVKEYGVPCSVLAVNRGGLFRNILQLPAVLLRFYRIFRSFNPDMVVSEGSLHCSWVCALARVPHVVFTDTEPGRWLDTTTFTRPIVKAKLTPSSYYRQLGRDHFRYPGNHELAYLHPRRFTAQERIRTELGLAPGESYVMVRFVAWKAFHDFGKAHMSGADRAALVRLISRHKRLFISSEIPLAEEMRSFVFPLAPARLHDALAFADLYVGEGATMASEAAVLGTPAVLINVARLGYCIEAENEGMLVSFPQYTEQARKKIGELLEMQDIRAAFAAKHQAFLASKIDVTAFMTWFIECYPESLARMREDPEYAGRFV